MIDALPAAPAATDSVEDFDAKSFAFNAALALFRSQANALGSTTQTNADITAALALAIALPAYGGTSSDSVAVGTGAKSFTTQAGKSWVAGQIVVVSNGSNYMKGAVTSYSGSTLAVNVTSVGGSGTFASWLIGLGFNSIPGLAASGANTDITSLNAPALGAATATTTSVGDNSTRVATMAAVNAEIANDVGVANSGLVKTAVNASGSAGIYAPRAWCYFSGALTGTNAPAAGGGISSVTRTSQGQYTINFATAMPDAGYAISATSKRMSGNTGGQVVESEITARTTSSVSIIVTNQGGSVVDSDVISLVIFR